MSEVVRESRRRRDPFVFGIVLVVIGLIALADQVWQPSQDVGGWLVLAIGVGLLAAFAYTRQYGYLVPGGIMTGLGAGILVSQAVRWTTSEAEGGAVTLGLGLGFLSILAIGELTNVERHRWWPLIPGSILSFVGTSLLIGGQAVRLLDYWGVILVVIGLLFMWRTWADRGAAPR